MLMRMAIILGLAGLLAPVAAQAGCQGELLLSCPIAGSDKHLDMCLDGDELVYSFGRAGSPELVLYEPLSEGTYTPWQGIGRSINEEVAFRNEGYSYIVSWALDRLEDNHPVYGGVTILKDEKYVTRLECEAGSVGPSFEPSLTYAMGEIGLCWDRDAFGWTAAACQE
jgi:hypothetical protein